MSELKETNEENKLTELRNLLEVYRIPGGCNEIKDYETVLGNGYLYALDKRNETLFKSNISFNGSKQVIKVTQQHASLKDSKNAIEVMKSCNSAVVEDRMIIVDGNESLTFIREFLPSDTSGKPYLSSVRYGIIENGFDHHSLQYDYRDFRNHKNGNKDGIVYFVKAGVPRYGAKIDIDTPRANRALYRTVNGNIDLFTEYLVDYSDYYVEGGCYQEINKEVFEMTTKYDPCSNIRRTFGRLNFPEIKSAILYTGCAYINERRVNYEFEVLKTRNGISVVYYNDEGAILNENFASPRLSSTEINSAEVKALILELQKRFPNDKFISIVIGELNIFIEELNSKRNNYPKLAANKLSPMYLDVFPYDLIREKADFFFGAARCNWEETTLLSDGAATK